MTSSPPQITFATLLELLDRGTVPSSITDLYKEVTSLSYEDALGHLGRYLDKTLAEHGPIGDVRAEMINAQAIAAEQSTQEEEAVWNSFQAGLDFLADELQRLKNRVQKD